MRFNPTPAAKAAEISAAKAASAGLLNWNPRSPRARVTQMASASSADAGERRTKGRRARHCSGRARAGRGAGGPAASARGGGGAPLQGARTLAAAVQAERLPVVHERISGLVQAVDLVGVGRVVRRAGQDLREGGALEAPERDDHAVADAGDGDGGGEAAVEEQHGGAGAVHADALVLVRQDEGVERLDHLRPTRAERGPGRMRMHGGTRPRRAQGWQTSYQSADGLEASVRASEALTAKVAGRADGSAQGTSRGKTALVATFSSASRGFTPSTYTLVNCCTQLART